MERDKRPFNEKESADTNELVYLHLTHDKNKACVFSYTGYKDKRLKMTNQYIKKIDLELKELSKKMSFEEVYAQLKTSKFTPEKFIQHWKCTNHQERKASLSATRGKRG